jgi:Ni,Fe-hydrogenase III large subunit/Ni,Fe-hydrogenase III component G
MHLPGLKLDLKGLPAPIPLSRGMVDAADWSAAALAVAECGGRLVALWGSDRRQGETGNFVISAAYAMQDGMIWLDLPLTGAQSGYPDISGIFSFAGRMQRATADLLGIHAENAADTRPWLNHGAWPVEHFPLRREVNGAACFDGRSLKDYPFVRVEGDGVHEIAVGPVHAGIIEPGHFRFSVVGEKVLRLEERLGYKHKGIEKRFEQLPASEGHRLAGRVSGDSTVAYAWAYCMALESAWNLQIPARASWLRALMLERERVANHLGDLGALGNDAAFSFGLAQFMCLKEDWLRLNKELFGHRFMMDKIIPGGVDVPLDAPLDAPGLARLVAQCELVEREVHQLRSIYDNHAGLQDRFITTGRVVPELAKQLGLTGFAARASGISHDLRVDFPISPYRELGVKAAFHRSGDVAARAKVRFEEILESLRLIRRMASGLPDGEQRVNPDKEMPAGFGAGRIEGWRGEIFVALEIGASDQGEQGNRILRCHCHDPSWQNWPVLEYAVIGNIVPDFPLINKSFNLSYSGPDL